MAWEEGRGRERGEGGSPRADLPDFRLSCLLMFV